MSWSFRKAGAVKETLKLAVMAEHAPESIKDEICRRIDSIGDSGPGQVMYVASHGHLDLSIPDRPWYCVGDIKINVEVIPLIDTPVAMLIADTPGAMGG